uniref:Uncharacterized protein n=1 Tax=Sinocyclocheilus grahami TaxID=75366 RepID=A0A672RMS5_SINGR
MAEEWLRGFKELAVNNFFMFLKENVGEELDPALDPVLLRQTYTQEGNIILKLGDTVVHYHDDFKMYITTKLPNPHYSPEISPKVTLINFTLSPRYFKGDRRSDPVLTELFRGKPVDHEKLIRVLAASKVKAEEIQVKVTAAEATERDIDATRLEYVPVAVRAHILFCVSDRSNVDPMYQYSLEWFLGIFMSGIANSKKADKVKEHIFNINEFFTFSLYSNNICRSFFEKHKLMFAFLLCSRILMNDSKIDMVMAILVIRGRPQHQAPNPAPNWLSMRTWQDMLSLSTLPTFSNLPESFSKHESAFKSILYSSHTCREPLPGEWDSALDSFQNLLVLRCLRADRLTHGLQDFVASQLGQNFIEPQVPTHIEVMKFSKKMSTISLGQGQGPSAEAMMHSAMEKGQWVFFQNCHLAPSWMPSLERLIENIDPDKVHRDFRLWLGSLPNNKFPVSILQNGSKMTIVPPRGIKANLLRTYASLTDDFIISCTKVPVEKNLRLSSCLCVFSLEFTDGDLHICISQLKMFLDEYQNIPYKAKPDNYYSDYSLMHTLFSPLHIKIIEEIVKGIVEKIPSLINVQEGVNKYPVMYEESMNTVLVQEVIR